MSHVQVVGDGGVKKIYLRFAAICRQEPVDCLLAGNASMTRCSTTLTEAQAREDDSTTARLSGFGGVRLLETKKWFCSGNRCPMVIGNTIAYIDTNHASDAYVTVLAPVFRIAFRKTLAAPPVNG